MNHIRHCYGTERREKSGQLLKRNMFVQVNLKAGKAGCG